MEIGNIVRITWSSDLSDMKLMVLCGRSGRIVEIVYSAENRITGCWIKLDDTFEKESEWFIPIDSIAVIENK